MKQAILTLVFVTSLAGLSYWVFEMPAYAGNCRQECENRGVCHRGDTSVYCIKVPAGLDTMAFSAGITLDSGGKFHELKLPNGGTETNVLLYDSTYLTALQHHNDSSVAPLVTGDFSVHEEVLLDITDIERGKYYIQYSSCNTGGIFPLTIQ